MMTDWRNEVDTTIGRYITAAYIRAGLIGLKSIRFVVIFIYRTRYNIEI